MSTNRTAQTRNGRKIIGGALLIVGFAVMLAYLGMLGFQVRAFADASPIGLMGSCVGLGLTSLRLITHLAFNYGAVFSLVYKMLVLFSALAVIVAGLALLPNRAPKTASGHQFRTQQPSKGEK